MSETNELLQTIAKQILEQNQIDVEGISKALQTVADQALKTSIDTSGMIVAANKILKSLHVLDSLSDTVKEEYVSDEASELANQIVDKVEINPVFNNCTFNINVPEKSNKWTRDQIIGLIAVILALIFGAINVYQNIDKGSADSKKSTTQIDTAAHNLDSILTSTSELIQITTNDINVSPNVSMNFKTDKSIKG